MKVLIIGGTKFIGREIAKQCQKKGYQLTLFNRRKSQKDSDIPTIEGDVENLLDYQTDFIELDPDIVVHCIANSEKNALDCIEVFKNMKARVIVLSSQDCYEAFQNLVRGKDVKDFPINESSPVTKIKNYWSDLRPNDTHGSNYDKNLMTNAFINAYKNGLVKPTIFRLPMVYGPHDHQYKFRHAAIIRRIIDKRKVFVLSSNQQNKIWSFGYIENIASAIIYSFDKDITIGKIYNIGERNFRSWRSWCELFAQYCNWSFDFKILPDEVLEGSNKILDLYPNHIITSNELYEHETGFIEPISLKESIIKTFDFALKNTFILGESDDYEKEDSLIEKYENYLSKMFK